MIGAFKVFALVAVGRMLQAKSLVAGNFGKQVGDLHVDYLLMLRGFAACGVVFAHMAQFGPHSLSKFVFRGTDGAYDYVAYARDHDLPHILLAALTPIDATSFVLLFFVLSGYLMGKIFFTGQYQAIGGLKRFYKARFLRLAPLLYFNLLVCVGLFSGADLDPIKLIGDILFITNFTDRGVNPVTWSLSIEMQYYLICPFVYLMFQKQNRASLICSLLLPLLIFVAQLTLSFMSYFYYTYAFLLGFSVNHVLLAARPAVSKRAKAICIIVLVVLLHISAAFLHIIGYGQASLLSAALFSTLLVYVAELPIKGPVSPTGIVDSMWLRFFMFTGVLSYGIYLWHYVIIVTRVGDIDRLAMTVAKGLGLTRDWQLMLTFHAVEIPLIFIMSIALAYATFITIETRFRPGLYSAQARRAEPVRQQN
jgi:peptidoglycan/LPS O-acetylase OafA/YrhL